MSLPYVNPVTGPIYVDGAEKGDTLAVTIVEIKPAREFGVSATIPEFGGLCGTSLTRVLNYPVPERVWIHTITDDGIIYDPNLDVPRIPLEPFTALWAPHQS
jgi:acetamidase/formamidase